MAHITITAIAEPVTVMAGGLTLGESHKALELKEGSYPPVTYIPRADIDMARLERLFHQPPPRQLACRRRESVCRGHRLPVELRQVPSRGREQFVLHRIPQREIDGQHDRRGDRQR